MEITYTQKGDYLYPNLTIDPEDQVDVGKYGQMRRRFLNEHRPGIYGALWIEGRLTPHLLEINEAAFDQIDLIVRQLLKAYPAPDRSLDHDDVLVFINEFAGCQFLNEHRGDALVQLGEVEIVQGLLVRERRGFETPAILVLLPGACLCHEQIQQQIAEIRVGPGLAQDTHVICECRQLQLLGQQLYLLFSVVNHETAAPFPYRESYASRSTGGTVTACLSRVSAPT